MTRQGKRRKVLIIGGGIGGPIAGMWLRRVGFEVVVAEARAEPALAEGAFLGVAPNGMHTLAQLGLADAVLARGFACTALEFSNRKGARLGAIDRSEDRARFGWPLTMIKRSDLHVLLASEAQARGVELRFAKRLTTLDRSRPSEVIATFADGSEDSGDLVLGCDGINSQVRKLILPDAPAPRSLDLLDCGGYSRAGAVPVTAGVNAMVFGRRAFFAAFSTGESELWWFHNGPLPGARLDAPTLRERLLELHREDPPWIHEVIESTPELLGPWSLHELADMPRWYDGRVCLLGDAAHAMSPSAGQGASMAMEDALVLAQCLRDIDEPSQAFAAFERRRRPRVDAVMRIARRNGSGKAVAGPVAEWFRDRMLPVFLRLGESAQTKGFAHRIAWEEQELSAASR